MSSEVKGKKEVSFAGAFGIFAVIIVVIIAGRMFMQYDVALLLMFCGMFSTAVYTMYYGFTWSDLFDKGVVPMIARASGSIMILLTVGPLIAAWMLSGTIPYIIYLGLQILEPKTFLVAAFLICCLSSSLTGTSWGTAATFGVALMGIAHGLGVSLPATAGAVVGGAYFGDKLSPISDTTVLAAAVAEVDVVDHIRSMIWTTFPAFLISIGIYFYVGSNASGEMDLSQVNTIVEAIGRTFKTTPLVLIPPFAVLLLAYKRMPTLPVLWIAIVLSIPLALMQGFSLADLMKAMSAGPKISTGVENIDKLLSRGGLSFMTGSVVVVFFAYIFAGQLEVTGTFHKICSTLKEKFISGSKGRAVFSTSLTGILTGLGTGNSYLSEIVPGTMYKDLYDDMNISRRVLSRTLEDSGTVVVAIIPWSAAGIYMSSVLDVPVLEYLPWTFVCYMGFITAWIYGFANIAIWPSDRKSKNE